MSVRPIRLAIPFVAIALLAGITACAPGATTPDPAATSGTVASGEPTTDPGKGGAPATPAEAPTCETLISAATVTALKEQGWSARQRDFAIGPDVVAGGLECPWSDYSTASDRGLLYGWAPISADAAVEAQKSLVAQGWIREEDGRGVYVTVDPKFAFTKDDDGYGMTYLFGDGWVTVSDTKQGLVLITVPG
ncbi:hypothetical protein J2Y69_000427 [Microbacterium resistens]|uniref:Nitrate ABC transporter substrate-binding protein n=1 Tax=Microbacterium resistens TaxID=156977 RepID=A0ABU1S897_9MICO|nr:hypothetical protein [Microbacterium resistens]MDR6865842.1 hypothetical protein [Microbacterium resistens]